MWANLNLLHNDVTLEDSYTKRMNAPWTDLGGGGVWFRWRVQEFVRGGAKSERLFFFCFSIFQGGGPAQKIGEKMIFPTIKVAKCR